ncbi:MAG: putative DNA modification/repair radical SAM protein [Anaerolineales bacterium]|nr:putative DNA modification/repair radical SAM protein [Anaerolineales bacterium]
MLRSLNSPRLSTTQGNIIGITTPATIDDVEHLCYTACMSDIERLELLTRQMHLEPAEDYCSNPLPSQGKEAIAVKTALMPNGQTIRLLKTLLSSYCEKNCIYCPFRSQRDFPRAAFTPDDFARLFNSLYQSGFVEGIFLSSSVFHGAVKTQDLLLDTASILRKRYQFRGYLHLKIMPGAEKDQIQQAMLLADRLSVNLEAPHSDGLAILAPQKDFHSDLLNQLRWIEEIRTEKSPVNAWKGSWPSSATQFVVGAAGETDLDLLAATENLYHQTKISRVYYSSFNPIEGTPLENHTPSSPRREFRLYQASYLLRDYGFSGEELVYKDSGNLSREIDPKLAWAEQHLLHQPLEINTASRSKLLRIPGIGPTRADNILSLRLTDPIKSFTKLRKMNLITPKSSPYILINGKSPPLQPRLF